MKIIYSLLCVLFSSSLYPMQNAELTIVIQDAESTCTIKDLAVAIQNSYSEEYRKVFKEYHKLRKNEKVGASSSQVAPIFSIQLPKVVGISSTKIVNSFNDFFKTLKNNLHNNAHKKRTIKLAKKLKRIAENKKFAQEERKDCLDMIHKLWEIHGSDIIGEDKEIILLAKASKYATSPKMQEEVIEYLPKRKRAALSIIPEETRTYLKGLFADQNL